MNDTEVLKAEVVALQAILIGILRRMATDRRDLAPIICEGFDEAETVLAGVAVKVGPDVPHQSTVGALAVLEEIRRAVVRDERLCGKSH